MFAHQKSCSYVRDPTTQGDKIKLKNSTANPGHTLDTAFLVAAKGRQTGF
jgi:hypothetical protein